MIIFFNFTMEIDLISPKNAKYYVILTT